MPLRKHRGPAEGRASRSPSLARRRAVGRGSQRTFQKIRGAHLACRREVLPRFTPSGTLCRANRWNKWGIPDAAVQQGECPSGRRLRRFIIQARARPRPGAFGYQAGPTNVALGEAQGECIAYVDHDDQWRPHHLRTLDELFAEGTDFAATRSRVVDLDGRQTSVTHPSMMLWHPEIQLMDPLFGNSCAGHHRRLTDEVGGWRESPVGLEDWDLWLRFSHAGARCATTQDITVDLLEERSTRRNSLPCDQRHVLAVYEDPRDARAALRAITHPKNERKHDEFTSDRTRSAGPRAS